MNNSAKIKYVLANIGIVLLLIVSVTNNLPEFGYFVLGYFTMFNLAVIALIYGRKEK